MGSEFAQDTAVEQIGHGRWRGTITPRWNVGDAPNGGYTMAMALRALRSEMPHPDPLTVTGHYLRRCDPGPVELATEIVKAGRTTSSGEVRLHQAGRERLRVLASFADGADVDLLGLCVVCDAFPPSAFDLGAVGWVPTIELTVHLRGHPAPGWLRARIGSRYLTGGFVEEDVELWDAEDRLVALSRQMAYAATVTGAAGPTG